MSAFTTWQYMVMAKVRPRICGDKRSQAFAHRQQGLGFLGLPAITPLLQFIPRVSCVLCFRSHPSPTWSKPGRLPYCTHLS